MLLGGKRGGPGYGSRARGGKEMRDIKFSNFESFFKQTIKNQNQRILSVHNSN